MKTLLVGLSILHIAAVSADLQISPAGQETVEAGEALIVTCNILAQMGHDFYDWTVGSSMFRLEKTQNGGEWFPVNSGKDLLGDFLTSNRFALPSYQVSSNFTILPNTVSINFYVTVSGLGASDYGRYRCAHIKENQVVQTSSIMELFIRAEPTRLTLTSETNWDDENGTAYNETHSVFKWDYKHPITLSCVSVGGMPNPNVTLTIGGKPPGYLDTDFDFTWEPEQPINGFQERTTTITKEMRHYLPNYDDDGKLVECKSMNKDGIVYFCKTASIMMSATAPSIICDRLKPAYLNAVDYSIRCQIFAKPAATKIWWEFHINGQKKMLEAAGPPGYGYYPTLDQPSPLISVATLKMSRVSSDDFQIYKLFAENDLGTAVESLVLQKAPGENSLRCYMCNGDATLSDCALIGRYKHITFTSESVSIMYNCASCSTMIQRYPKNSLEVDRVTRICIKEGSSCVTRSTDYLGWEESTKCCNDFDLCNDHPSGGSIRNVSGVSVTMLFFAALFYLL